MLPKISIIIPAYNSEKFLGRCLRSIINQTIPSIEYEIILVDDGSNDKTNFIAEIFGKKVKIFKNIKNLGLASALNKGISQSKGKYIVRMDSDDYVNENFLKFLHYFLDVNPKFDAVCCDYLLVNEDEKIIKRCNAMENPIGCAIMFRKNVFKKIGQYDNRFRMNEEVEFIKRFKENGLNLGHLELPLYRYRRHLNNLTNDVKNQIYYDKLLKDKIKKK